MMAFSEKKMVVQTGLRLHLLGRFIQARFANTDGSIDPSVGREGTEIIPHE
jgi:hypothetical protein